MGFSISGYILEPPRIGQSNSPFTSGPNNFVPQTLLPVVGSPIAITYVQNDGNGRVQITTGLATGVMNGQIVFISLVLGVPGANGEYTVTVVDVHNFVLNHSTFSGSYAGGGQVLVASLVATCVFTVTTASPFVTTSSSMVGILSPGDGIVFLDQSGVTYEVESVSPSVITVAGFYTQVFPNGITDVTVAYSPQHGTDVQAYNNAYPKSELNPRDDYLVLCTSELAPGSGASFPVAPAGVHNFSNLVQITVATGNIVSDGQTVVVSGVLGVPGANGTFTVSVLQFMPESIFVLNGSAFSGAYAGGGNVTVLQGTPGLLVNAGFGWTKNEVVQRFDYNSHRGSFVPLEGGPVTVAGTLNFMTGAVQLKVMAPLEQLSDAPFRLSIGTFGSGITQNVLLVLQDTDFTPGGPVTPGNTELSLASGKLNWNATDLTTYDGQSVQWQQQQYFALGTSTGDIGTLSTSSFAPAILLNPIPGHGQFPLIRIGFLYWLTTVEVPDESHFSPSPGPPPGTVEWARDTGRLNFNNTPVTGDSAVYDGTVIYQDGTLFQRDIQLPRLSLGPMPSNGLMGPIPAPIPASGDIIFFIPANPAGNAPYYQFPNSRVVGALDSGVSGIVEILQSTGEVKFSDSDASNLQGQDVGVVFGDLLIDHGISIRFFRSSVNLSGQTPGVKDVTAVYAVQNAVWASPIIGSPIVFLPSTPVDDNTLVVFIGQGTGTFTGTLNFVGGQSPIPGLGYLLKFDTNQITFAEYFQNIEIPLLMPTQGVQLPNTLILTTNVTFALETGTDTGVFLPLTPGVDCLVDGMAGLVYFTSTFGVAVFQGSTGVVSGTAFTDPLADFTEVAPPLPVLPGDYLLVLMDTGGTAKGVYQIIGIPNATTLTVDVAAPAGSGQLGYQILRNKEIMADRFFQTVALTDPTTSVERITSLGTIHNATTLIASGSATFPDQQTLSDPSADFSSVLPGDTITLLTGPAAGQTYLVKQVSTSPETLTPFTSFTSVTACTYSVTRRLQVPVGFIGSIRFRFGVPSVAAPYGIFSTSVVVKPTDANFSAPASLSAGTVEVSQATGNLNFSQMDVSSGVVVFVSRLLTLTTDYLITAGLGFIQFTSRLLTNEEVLLMYTQVPPNTTPPTPPAPPFTERGTFLVRKELTQPHPNPATTLTFNPLNKSVAGNPAPKVFRGGRPQTSKQVSINGAAVPSTITFLPDPASPPVITDALPHGAVVSPSENVYIDYYIFQAMGGELSITVLNSPILTASVLIAAGTNAFLITGDHTANFPAGFLMVVNANEVYQIGSASYNVTAKQTTVTLNGTQEFQSDQTSPSLQVASGPTPLAAAPFQPAYFTMELAPYYPIARGVNTFSVPGDKRGIYRNNVVLYVTDATSSFTDFYLVSGSKYDGATDLTTIALQSNALRQYQFGQQSLFWSVRPVFGQAPTVVQTSRSPITIPTPEPVTVIRRISGQVGKILSTPTDYTIDGTGQVTYVKALQPDEEFSVFYTGARTVAALATGSAGPRFQASYTATIVPDLATNGLLGQVLSANYTVFNPDSFFYRVETMTIFKGQVEQEIQQSAQSQSSTQGSGPMTSNTASPQLYKQGQPSVWFPPGNYANHDLIAQAALLYFNNAINDLEDVLHAIDGRIVGDVDGRFQFDGVLGRYDYFTYDPTLPSPPFSPPTPAFPLIANQIDDLVQVLPGPIPAYPISTFWFQPAYQTGPTSRFYQTLRNVIASNPLVVSASPTDHDIVGTFEFSPITVAPSTMFKRFPRAQTLFDSPFGQSVFPVDDVTGSGTLRPSWTSAGPPAAIIGMLIVIEDPQGNFYVDENDNYTVIAVAPPSGTTPGQITISGIPHEPVGPTGSPPSPSGGSSPTETASVISLVGSTATIAGLRGMGPNQVGLQLTLSDAASDGNNGTFTVTSVVSSTVAEIDNPGAVPNDGNNGSIGWIMQPLSFVPAGSTIYVSPIDVCVAQQLAQDVDSDANGTYGQTYRIGRDVYLDQLTGNIGYEAPYWPFNGNSTFKLPTLFIPSSSYVIPVSNGDILEMNAVGIAVTYTSPYKFPALTGLTLDDDGNQTIPIVGPTFDGEMTEAGGGSLYVEYSNEAVGSNFLTEITTLPYPATGNITGAPATTIHLTSAIAFPGNVVLLGTFSVTKGSAVVPTSVSQTAALFPGNVVQFGSQPNSRYTVISVVGGASPQITLSYPYSGTTAAPTTADIPLAGTFGVTRNSTSVSASVSQTGIINQGDTLVFATQPTNTYGVASVTSNSATLSGTFTVAASVTVTTATSQVGVLKPGYTVQFGLQPGIPYTVATVTASNITLTASYNGTPGVTSGTRLTSRIVLTSVYLALTNNATTAVKKLLGTFSVTNGSPSVLTSASQVGMLSFGDLISFGSQTGVLPYVVAGTALTGTFHVTHGSSSVPTTANQTAVVHANDTVTFSSQPNVGYLVLTVTASTITLTTNYSGTTDVTATGTKTDITSIAPYMLTLTTNYTGLTTASSTATNVTPGPAQYNLVRVIGSTHGNDSHWRPIQSVTSNTVTVAIADAWSATETGVHFAVAVSAANVFGLGTATLSGTILMDSNSTDNGPFVGGPVAMLGNTYGVMTFLASSYNTTTLDTLFAIPPPTAQANWGSFTMASAVSIGDVVAGPGIDPSATVTVVQIGPGNSIQLSEATTGGALTGGIFFLQFTQPPPSGTPIGPFLANVVMGTTVTGSQGTFTAFSSPTLTFTDPSPSSPFNAGMVGQTINITGGTTYSNNKGSFTITGATPTTLQIENSGGIAPDPPSGPGTITWTIPPSPSIIGIELPSLVGFQLGATVTDTGAAIPGGTTLTQIGPGFQITLSNAPTANDPTDMVTVTTTVPPTPWSTTVDSLFPNFFPPTQSNTDGFKQAMQVAPLVVSGNGIVYNPELIPPQVTIIESIGGSPPADTDTSFVMSLPATTSSLTGLPLAFSSPTGLPTILTIYIPYTLYPGWTVVITSGPFAGERRNVVAVIATNQLLVDHPFQSASGSYRLENTLDTYNGATLAAIQEATVQEVDVISTRARPVPPPYIYNLQSEQNALNDFFTVVFTTLIGPSTGTVSNIPPGPAPFMILTDNSVDFIGPDPANPLVTTADFVYVTLGTDVPVAQGFLATIATAVVGVAQFSDPTAAFSVGDIGKYVIISGATIPANSGTFQIVSFTSASQVGINNAAATSVGETNNGSLNWFEYATNPVQEQDQGIYSIANVLGPHQLMVSAGFPASGSISYSITSAFGVHVGTLQKLFSIFESNNTFVAQTRYFQSLLSAIIPVQLNGAVDSNAYANGLNDVNNDMLSRYNQVANRLKFLSSTALTGAQAYIQAALSSTDNLYAMRYSWINARINLVSGYLVLQNTALATVAANQAAAYNQLIQLLTIQGS